MNIILSKSDITKFHDNLKIYECSPEENLKLKAKNSIIKFITKIREDLNNGNEVVLISLSNIVLKDKNDLDNWIDGYEGIHNCLKELKK